MLLVVSTCEWFACLLFLLSPSHPTLMLHKGAWINKNNIKLACCSIIFRWQLRWEHLELGEVLWLHWSSIERSLLQKQAYIVPRKCGSCYKVLLPCYLWCLPCPGHVCGCTMAFAAVVCRVFGPLLWHSNTASWRVVCLCLRCFSWDIRASFLGARCSPRCCFPQCI